MPPRFGNRGSRSSSSSSRRSSGTGRQQRQRSQRSRSRSAQRSQSQRDSQRRQQQAQQQQAQREERSRSRAAQRGIKPRIRDVKAEQEANEASYLNKIVPGTSGAAGKGLTHQQLMDDRAKAAYDASRDRQQQVRDAIALADKYKDNQGNINVGNISDQDLKTMRDAKLFAMESSGELGGTFGAEVVVNKLKQQLAETGDTTALERLGYDPGVINSMDPYMEDPNNPGQYIANPNYGKFGNLGFDPTATKTWGDVESDNTLKHAYYTLQDLNANPSAIKQHLPQLTGYSAPKGIGSLGGGGGGWGGGYGGGGDGGAGGFQYNRHAQQGIAQGPPVNPGSLQEQVNQGFLGGMGAPRFSRGGIVSLLRLRR